MAGSSIWQASPVSSPTLRCRITMPRKPPLSILARAMSKAFATDGIHVNTVSPAFIRTPLVDEMLAAQAKANGIEVAEAEAQFLAVKRPHIELHRAGRPEEVAAACVFLASEAASFI